MKISNKGKTCKDCEESASYIDMFSQEEVCKCWVFDDAFVVKPDQEACDYFYPRNREPLDEEKLLELAEQVRKA